MEYVIQPEYCPTRKIRDKTLEYLEYKGYKILEVKNYEEGDCVILYSILKKYV